MLYFLWDVYSAHLNKEVLRDLNDCRIKVVFIPPSQTDWLQPLDISVNRSFKAMCRKEYSIWKSKMIYEKGFVDYNSVYVRNQHLKWTSAVFNHIKGSQAGEKMWKKVLNGDQIYKD